MSIEELATQEIDRLLHDAQHAESGYQFASMIGHHGTANELREKYERLRKEAEQKYLECPGAKWPHADDCEWPAPKRRPSR